MNHRRDFERALGSADPAFVASVQRTMKELMQSKEEKVVKKFGIGLVAALTACVLMTAIALAAANPWGIMDFLTKRQGAKPLPGAEDIIAQPDAVRQGAHDVVVHPNG
jgi:hypothetical protein